MISLTEGLYACLLIIIDTMSVRSSGSELTSESCPARTLAWEHLLHIGLSCQVRHSLFENKKMQGERNSESHRRLHQTHQTQSFRTRTQEHLYHETSYLFLTISTASAGVTTFDVSTTSQRHLPHGCMSCTKFLWWCSDPRELSGHPYQTASTYILEPSANSIFFCRNNSSTSICSTEHFRWSKNLDLSVHTHLSGFLKKRKPHTPPSLGLLKKWKPHTPPSLGLPR